jgi:hypothetical protein
MNMSDQYGSTPTTAAGKIGVGSARTSAAATAMALKRLDQLSSHLKPKNGDQSTSNATQATLSGLRRGKPRSQIEALPPDFSDVLSRVKTMKSIASNPPLQKSWQYPLKDRW